MLSLLKIYPLDELLKKDSEFKWSNKHDVALKKIKEIISSANCLVHYDPTQEIVVSADSSSYGIGGVIAHRIKGREYPIAFCSCTLNVHEKRYSQIDREAVALVYVVKHFHQFLFGNHFILKTDHKPLTSIFHPEKAIPSMVANRMQRNAVFGALLVLK